MTTSPDTLDTLGRPSDPDAERVVVAAVMRRPELIDELADTFDPADLADPQHRWAWSAVDELRHEPAMAGEISFIAVADRLRQWHAAGTMPIRPLGTGELCQIAESGTLAASVGYYAQIVTRCAKAARTIDLAFHARQLGRAADFDADTAVTDLQLKLDEISATGMVSLPSRIGDRLDDALERAVTPASTESRVPTGFADLDSLTGGGFRPGRLVVIGARPGVGKTTLGTGLARGAAIGGGVPTLFVTLEMGEDEIVDCVLSAEARVALHHISSGTATAEDASRLATARQSLDEAPLYIHDDSSVTLSSLRGLVRHLVRTVGLREVVIDYLQLMQAPKAESRQVAVSMLSRGLKLMAKEFGITVVLLSQLNRESEKRQDKRPTIADLRESGAVEQDADMVILLHRPDMHEPESPRAGEVDLIVDKFRGGPRATITAAWQGHYARLVDMAAPGPTNPRRTP